MKPIPAKVRRALLLGLLAATVAAAVFEPAEDEIAQPASAGKNPVRAEHRPEAKKPEPAEREPINPEPGKTGPQHADISGLQLDKLKRAAAPNHKKEPELFPAKSWYIAPPEQKPAPLAPPAAPPLPFSYMGKLMEDGKPVVFLNIRERNFIVKEGDIVAGNYRVEKIQPQMVTMTYLPLNMQQTLMMGASN